MNRKLLFGGGLLAGLGMMSLLDPERGRRRRALLRDKLARSADAVSDGAGMTWRDLRNRARGLVAEATSLVRRRPVSDDVLVARVRSHLGRVVSHPRSIDVAAREGRISLSGPVFAEEADRLISCASDVRGVREVEDRLERHQQAGDVPGLQGGRRPAEPRFEYMQRNWSPAARLVGGTAGATLVAWGVKRRGFWGSAAVLLGTGLVARSATNLELDRLFGLGPSRRGIDVQNSITVAAPVEEVFRFWSNFENFPRFMSHVREVRDNGKGCSHWVVAGPAGASVEWDAVTTASVPEQLLAWKSAPGAALRHAGIVRFDPTEDGGTRLQIRMTYKPPAGAVGHAIATLLGSDPRKMMDANLLRFQSLMETGKTTAHDQKVRKEEVEPSARAATPPTIERKARPRAERTKRRGPEPTI